MFQKKKVQGGTDVKPSADIIDAYTMMTKQPKKLTSECFQDFHYFEICPYSIGEKENRVKNFIEGR